MYVCMYVMVVCYSMRGRTVYVCMYVCHGCVL